MKITVFGAGGWGTALASILADKHETVTLYVRKAEVALSMRNMKENVRYLLLQKEYYLQEKPLSWIIKL